MPFRDGPDDLQFERENRAAIDAMEVARITSSAISAAVDAASPAGQSLEDRLGLLRGNVVSGEIYRPSVGSNGPAVTSRRRMIRPDVEKYKPNVESEEIIGVQQTPYSIIVLDNPAAALTETTFDSTSFSEGIEFLYTNNTGSSVNLRGHVIRGELVTRLSGEEGFLNDEFIDFEDVYENGEVVLEIGNNFIVTRDQVDHLAEYHAKWNFDGRHMYVVVLTGAHDWLEIGDWYTLDMQGPASKFEENIDSVVECVGVEIDAPVGRISTTVVTFQEVYQNFQPTWNVAGKFYSIGPIQRTFSRGGVVRVSSDTDADSADYYCDGTADDVQLQAAIDLMAANGGGTVLLSQGTFKTTSTIVLKSNITVLGSGIGQTVIEKNVNGEAFEAIGTSGSELSNIRLFGFTVTKNASDATATTLVFFDYADSVEIQNVAFNDSGNAGLRMDNSDDATVVGCTSDSCAGVGFLFITCSNVTLSDSVVTSSGLTSIYFLSSNSCTVANCIVANMAATSGSGSSGIRIDNTPDSVVSNCVVRDISDTSNSIFSAFFLTGANVAISNCIAKNISSSTAQIRGIDSQAVVSNCRVSGVTATGGIAMVGIIADRVSNCEVSDMTRTGGTGGISGVDAFSCTSTKVSNLEIADATNANSVIGVSVNGNGRMAADITVDTLTTNGTGRANGVRLSQLNCSVSGANVQNCDDYGIYVSSDDCRVSACYAASNDYGIYVETTADKTVITGNRLTANTTANLQNNGTNTTTTGNDIT